MKFKCLAWFSAAMLVLITLSAPGAARGDDLIVDHIPVQPSDTNHFNSIQAAIDHAFPILSNTANSTTFRILVKADNVPYSGPITIRNSNVPIIGENTSGTTISGGSPTLISVSNLNQVGEIRNFTFKGAVTAILVANSSSLRITNSVFQLGSGATAIQVQNSPSTSIINNTFVSNDIAINTNSDILISNNIFFDNATPISSTLTLGQLSYNDFSPAGSNSNLAANLLTHSLPNTSSQDSNPLFVNQASDFHLQSGSPCIGTGNPTYPNTVGSTISDMGAYGGLNRDIPAPATVTGLTSSLTKADTATLSLNWDQVSGSSVTAYRVYYGATSGQYSGLTASPASPFLVPVATPSATVTGIPIVMPATPGALQNAKLIAQDKALLVSWDAADGATGYQILYGTDPNALSNSLPVAGGSQTSQLITGLTNGTPYFVTVQALAQSRIFAAVTAVIDGTVAANFGSASVNESSYSQETNQVIAEQDSAPSPVLSGTPEAPVAYPNLKGEGCFIATAAYGFYSAPQVQALRDFRDRYLLTNAPGRAFVAWYYRYGPRGAHFINVHPWLKGPVRLALFPLVVGALVLSSTSPLAKTALVVLAVILLAVLVQRKLRAPLRRRALSNLFLILLLVGIPGTALSAEARPDRPHWSLELKGGAFFPDLAHWSTFYGSNYMGEYGGALSYKMLRQLEVGLEGSYLSASGKGLLPTSQTLSGEVTLERAPLDLFVLARGVFNEDQLLVPYAAAGYTRLFYREEVKGEGTTKGSVNGYHARAGLQILLDGLEPDASRNLYFDNGIYHSYLFLEGKYLHAKADTVPSGSVNLGGTSCLGGLLFEF